MVSHGRSGTAKETRNSQPMMNGMQKSDPVILCAEQRTAQEG